MEYEKIGLPETFLIKVTLIECRQLTLGEGADVVSPYIIVKVGDQEKTTEVKKDNPDATFNKVFDFKVVTTISELKTIKILISIWHKTIWYRKDILIGTLSVDAWTVYIKPTHMLNKAWGAVEKENLHDTGFINYSVIVIGESDKLLALPGEMEENDDPLGDEPHGDKKKEDIRKLINGAPPLEMKSYLMVINIYKGEFVETPLFKELNTKIRIIVNEGDFMETNPIHNSHTPGWKEQFNIPMRSPFYITYVVVEVWYELSDEKLLGRFLLDFSQLVKDGSLEVKWYPIYGPESENTFIRKLKYHYKRGTDVEHHFYFGRILASAKWVPDENPSKSKNPGQDIANPDERTYIFWLDIYELTSKVLSSSDQIQVEAQVADKIICTKNVASYNSNLNKFFWKSNEIRFKQIELQLPADINQIPDIFIRVKKKVGLISSSEEYLAYKRFKPEELLKIRANVRPTWQTLRMCYTSVKGDNDENYLGKILLSINFFQKDIGKNQQRPVVSEIKNFKKYKLISIIYMANNLPVVRKGQQPSPRVQISFNGKTRSTQVENENINPVWGEAMKISTYLNDCLDLSDNIKLEVVDTNGITNTVLGKTEIEVRKIQKYNSQNYIENDIYQHAVWYSLYDGQKKLDSKVLACFLIVKLTKQGKEEIDITKRRLWPNEEKYRLYLFILGVRGVPNNISLDNGCVMTYIDKEPLERIEDKDEFFKKRGAYVEYDNNLNVYDTIAIPGQEYQTLSISDKKEFVKPISLIVMKDKRTLLTANVDLTQFLKEKKDNINSHLAHIKEKEEKKKKKKQEGADYKPPPEDYIPIYRDIYKSDIDITKENSEMYWKTFSKFPFEPEEANSFIGEEVTIHIYKDEYDKKGKLKNDDDLESNHNRPEIDCEYEEELPEKGLKFKTAYLKLSGGEANCGIIRYFLKLSKESNNQRIEKIQKNFLHFKKKMLSFKDNSKKCLHACRVYILNTSNLTIDDSSVEEGFVWIKRYQSDREHKKDKTPFKINSGEVNQLIGLKVIYPETFFINIQFFAIQKIAGLVDGDVLIGETKIDLERRFFHKDYEPKMDNHKKFKQIPIESRTIFLGKEAKGAVRMWAEILPWEKAEEFRPDTLNSYMIKRYELRLIIWNTRDIPVIDGGKVDILVRVQFNDGKKDVEQSTDTHADSKDGNGVFNWRVVIPFDYPNNKTSITISVYDWNLTSSNEMIGSNVINIKHLLNRAHRTNSLVEFPRGWLPLSKYF